MWLLFLMTISLLLCKYHLSTYSVFRSSTYFSSCVIQTERWLKNSVWAHDMQTTALGWIKEVSVTRSLKFWWATIGIMVKMITRICWQTLCCIVTGTCQLMIMRKLHRSLRQVHFKQLHNGTLVPCSLQSPHSNGIGMITSIWNLS